MPHEGPQQFYRNPDHDQPTTLTDAERRKFGADKARKAREQKSAETARTNRDAEEAEMWESRLKDPSVAALDAINRGRAGNEHIAPID